MQCMLQTSATGMKLLGCQLAGSVVTEPTVTWDIKVQCLSLALFYKGTALFTTASLPSLAAGCFTVYPLL